MVDTIVTLRLKPEIFRWNRNYFYVGQQHESMKSFCSIKPLLKSPELVFLCMGMLCYLALIFFHQKEPNFYLKHDVHTSLLNCKGKPMKDT